MKTEKRIRLFKYYECTCTCWADIEYTRCNIDSCKSSPARFAIHRDTVSYYFSFISMYTNLIYRSRVWNLVNAILNKNNERNVRENFFSSLKAFRIQLLRVWIPPRAWKSANNVLSEWFFSQWARRRRLVTKKTPAVKPNAIFFYHRTSKSENRYAKYKKRFSPSTQLLEVCARTRLIMLTTRIEYRICD